MHDMVARRDRKPKALEVIQAFGVLGQLFSADLLDIKNKDRKPAAPGDLCVLLAQRASCRIARIFEGSGPLQFLLGTEVLERFVRHINFAAHFEKFRCIFQLLRNASDGFDVGRYIFAHNAVAAGRCTHQRSIFVF